MKNTKKINYLKKIIHLLKINLFCFCLLFTQLGYSQTNFYVQGKGELCTPNFFGIDLSHITKDKDSDQSEYDSLITHYEKPCLLAEEIAASFNDETCLEKSPFKSIKSYVPSSAMGVDNCSSGKVCYCKLKDDDYFLPLYCNISGDIDSFKECDFSVDESYAGVKNSDACSSSELCYRIPKLTNSYDGEVLIALKNIQNLLKDKDTGENKVTLEQLRALSLNGNKGLCLPRSRCDSVPLSHNMALQKEDVCAPGLEMEEIDNQMVCIDPNFRSEVEVPDAIEFILDESNCSVFGMEIIDGEYSQADSFQNLMLPLPEGKLRVSPALITYSNYDRYLKSLQWLWGHATSPHAINPDNELPQEISKIGVRAKKAFYEFDVIQRYINTLRFKELTESFNKVKDELQAQEENASALADPQFAENFQIDSNKKMKEIIPYEIQAYRKLLGGASYINSLEIADGSKSEGKLLDENIDDSTYKYSLGFLKDGSGSLSSSIWERKSKEKKSCPSRWKISPNRDLGCKMSNGGTRGCRPIPGLVETFLDAIGANWVTAVIAGAVNFATFGAAVAIVGIAALAEHIYDEFTKTEPTLVNIKRCIDESIEITGNISENNPKFRGKLVNSIYPREMIQGKSGVELNVTGSFFGQRVKINSRDKFIELIKNGYGDFINAKMPAFSNEDKNILLDFLDGELLLNGVIPSPDQLNDLISSEEYSSLKREKIAMTPLEYVFYKNLYADHNDSDVYVDADDINKFREENPNHDEVLVDETLEIVSKSLYDHFLRMHFTRKQNSYDTSEVAGGAGFYKFPSSPGHLGHSLGYIKELYAMAEYNYKYLQGLEEGYQKQIECMEGNRNLVEDSLTPGGVSDSGASSPTSSSDIFFEHTQNLLSDIKTDDKKKTELKTNNKKILPSKKSILQTKASLVNEEASVKESVSKKVSQIQQANKKKDKKLAKILSKFRKKKIEKLKKINKNKKAQLIKQDELLKDVLAPVINKNAARLKNPSAKISNIKNKSVTSTKAKDHKKDKEGEDPFDMTGRKVTIEDNYSGTGRRNTRRRSRRNKNISNAQVKKNIKMVRSIKQNSNLYKNSNDDTLFERVSKVYIRAAFPVLLETNTNK